MKLAFIIVLLFFSYHVYSQECTSGDWNDGDKYEGNWKDGKQNAEGTYYYSNGAKYIWGWKLGKKDGEGVFVNANGKTFEGVWDAGKKIYKTNSLYKEWLVGTWKGTGYQTNGESWNAVLNYINSDEIKIDYPDFSSQGYLTFDQENSKQIFFIEKITKGQKNWKQAIKIVIEKENENKMGIYFISYKSQITSAFLIRE